MAADLALALWLLLLGPCVGSFMAAFAERTCRGDDVVRAPSRCRACGARLRVVDLVPILSFVALRGRCRACRAPIPRNLLAAEVAGLFLAIAALVVMGPGWRGVAGTAWLWLLLGLYLTDRACWRLPDTLTLPLLLAGLLLGSGGSPAALGPALGAAALGAGALWMLGLAYERLRGQAGLGLGDVKMMAGISAAVGAFAIPWVTLLAAAGAIAGALIAAGGTTRLDPQTPVPLGSFLALAGAAVWLGLEAF